MRPRSSKPKKRHRFGIKIDRTQRRTYNMQVHRQCSQCHCIVKESMQGECVCQCGGRMQLVALTW